MKKILALCMMFAICLTAATASDSKTTINRMVLKAAREFNNIVVDGDVSVELRYNPKYDGYIVYHYDKNSHRKISCHNDGNTLCVKGNTDAVMTRIVIFYGNELHSIVNNGDARLVARRLKCDKNNLDIIVNGNGDVRLGFIKTQLVNAVINSQGNLQVRHMKANTLNAVINSYGNILLEEKPDVINLQRNSQGDIIEAPTK